MIQSFLEYKFEILWIVQWIVEYNDTTANISIPWKKLKSSRLCSNLYCIRNLENEDLLPDQQPTVFFFGNGADISELWIN